LAKSHVTRPLYVLLPIVAAILIARYFVVPDDFGIQDRGYTYGFHRLSDEADWKAMPVEYKGSDYCKDCHPDETQKHDSSPHSIIQCENCHGPATGHPDNPEKLPIDVDRSLCLRCHAALPYPESGRAVVPGIDPNGHNPGKECVHCHNPHDPLSGL